MEVEVENAAAHVTPQTGGWLDKVLPVSALFVSFLSILLAWGNGEAMQDLVRQNERLVQANSLPYVQMFSNTGTEHFDLVISNAGIGPAEIRTAEMLIDGKPVRTIDEFLLGCCDRKERGSVSKSNVMGSMIRPGDSLNYIGIPNDPALLAKMYQAYGARRLELRVCYCSVFEECWTRSSRDFWDAVRPKPVGTCPMPAVPYKS